MARAFPTWLVVSGWIAEVLSLPLVGRLVYEQTYLTWKSGLQMIGFTFVHTQMFLALIGAFALFALVAWLIAAAVCLVAYRASRHRKDIVQFAAIGATVGIASLPYEFWQGITRAILGPS